jgi:hypothetical protein
MMNDFDAPALWLHRANGAPVIVNWGQVTRVEEIDGETYVIFSAVIDGVVDFAIVRETIDEIYTQLTGTDGETEAPPLAPGTPPAPMRRSSE